MNTLPDEIIAIIFNFAPESWKTFSILSKKFRKIALHFCVVPNPRLLEHFLLDRRYKDAKYLLQYQRVSNFQVNILLYCEIKAFNFIKKHPYTKHYVDESFYINAAICHRFDLMVDNLTLDIYVKNYERFCGYGQIAKKYFFSKAKFSPISTDNAGARAFLAGEVKITGINEESKYWMEFLFKLGIYPCAESIMNEDIYLQYCLDGNLGTLSNEMLITILSGALNSKKSTTIIDRIQDLIKNPTQTQLSKLNVKKRRMRSVVILNGPFRDELIRQEFYLKEKPHNKILRIIIKESIPLNNASIETLISNDITYFTNHLNYFLSFCPQKLKKYPVLLTDRIRDIALRHLVQVGQYELLVKYAKLCPSN